MTWTLGRTRNDVVPARPLEIAWVAVEVVAKRCIESAAGSRAAEAERARGPDLQQRRAPDVDPHEGAPAHLVEHAVGQREDDALAAAAAAAAAIAAAWLV